MAADNSSFSDIPQDKQSAIIAPANLPGSSSVAYQELLKNYKNLEQYVQEIETLYTINQFAYEEINQVNILQFYLDRICKLCHASIGHVYILFEDNSPEDKKKQNYISLWYTTDSLKYQSFQQQTENLKIDLNSDIPGIVLNTTTGTWLTSANFSQHLLRSQILSEANLLSAYALPIKLFNNVIAIAEFFFDHLIEDQAKISHLINNMTLQLSTTLEHKKSAQETKENYQKLLDAQLELKQLSHLDNLTKLPNREKFEEVLQRETNKAKSAQSTIAILIINLDQFKLINDSFGHPTGDRILSEVAQRLKAAISPADYLARIGGDEFGIILSNIETAQNAENVAQTLIKHLSTPYQIDDNIIALGASIGIACFPEAESNHIHLFMNADMAMNSAKSAGRNTYKFFSSTLQTQQAQRFDIENALRLAIDKDELFLQYQPIINLASGTVAGVEALLRWQHPTHGIISPDYFIPIAEETGLIIPIGQWVLLQACKAYTSWQLPPEHQYTLAINISSLQLRHSNFIQLMNEVLLTSNMPPHLLELELTETIASADIEEARETLNALQQMGIVLSIDDFGTGYSTLSRLKQLPINTLKIDKSFIKNINNDSSDALIVQSTISLARGLGLNVIAEGVETAEQAQFLINNNCPFAQGFYYSIPLHAHEIIALLYNKQ